MIHARIALPRAHRCRRVDPLQIGDHCADGAAQAVQIQPVEADRSQTRISPSRGAVEPRQPADELQHLAVGPQPGGKAFEGGQHLLFRLVGLQIPDMTIDRKGVRPIGLHRHTGKSQFTDQAAGQTLPRPVELAGAVGGFADQHQ